MTNKGENNDGSSNTFTKAWQLNIYELNREPHDIINEDTEIAVSPKVLQNELMCPICLDILKITMTTKECLHRFCHDCIITALRAGNKECPTCRKKLISKRSLRPDPNFDGIISKIYPNREEYDALHEKVLEKLNKKHLTAISSAGGGTNAALSTKINRQSNKNGNTLSPAITSKQSNSSKTPSNMGTKRTIQAANHSDDSDAESRTSTEQSSLHLTNETDEIELVLKPHPLKEVALTSNRFLKTTSNASINHLSKYLWTRLLVECGNSEAISPPVASTSGSSAADSDSNDFQVFINTSDDTKSNSSYQLLVQSMTLENVIEKYWRHLNRPLELFYFNHTNKVTS